MEGMEGMDINDASHSINNNRCMWWQRSIN